MELQERIYDAETDHWYLSEEHMKNSKKVLEAIKDWAKRPPLSREEVEEQARAWHNLGQMPAK